LGRSDHSAKAKRLTAPCYMDAMHKNMNNPEI
jgi:hypothetical protein